MAMWAYVTEKFSDLSAEVVVAFLNLLVPFGTDVRRDVPYAPGEPHRADIYRPDGASERPVVVYFYGGGWRGGSKGRAAYIGAALARRGFVAVLPEYRHFPAADLPDILADSAAAAAWTVRHAAEFGGDPRRVFVAGGSSGAWAAAMLALDNGWLDRAGSGTCALAGMIGISGPYAISSLTERRDREVFADHGHAMEPINLAPTRHPPMLLLVGSADTDVQPNSTIALATRLQGSYGAIEVRSYAGLNHDGVIRALTFPLAPTLSVPADIDRFLNRERDPAPC